MQINTKYTFRYFLKQLGSYPWLFASSLFGIALGVVGGMVTPWFFKAFVDLLAGNEPVAEIFEKGFWLLVAVEGMDLISWVGWSISRYTIPYLQTRVMKNIADHCFYQLHQHSFRFFNNQFVGGLVKKVNRMVRAFEDLTDEIYYQFFPLALRVMVIVGVMWWIQPLMGIIVLLWVFIFLGVQAALSRYKLKRYDLDKAAADTRVTAQLADTVTNHSTIQVFARLPYERREFKKVTNHWYNKQIASWIFNSHIEGGQALFMSVLNFGVLYLALRLWQEGTLTVGYFVLIQSYLWELYHAVWDFGRTLRHSYEHLADANEMSEILMTPFEVVDHAGARALKVSRGAVDFEKVTFSYSQKKIEGDGEVERDVLKQLSFEVKPGERIALIGPSGGGKTTITKLLLRLFDVQHGKILIDGQDVARVKQESLRAEIALVPQDPILFHRSIMDNIRYGRLDASDKEVLAAAKLAHCHEFISHFPQGYDTFVGERGVKLSGGERQRVAIARAILANTRILILDEATSSLDSESEKYIKDALKVLMKGKTVFVIAHRLSTVVDMDRIMVLEKGKIIEQGTHMELLAEGGLYRRLWDLQVGGYLA
jgi:ATP-binding cassette subfamily B protein